MNARRERSDRTPTTVMVFGVFDILHPGHLRFLEEARRYGDELLVVVTPDARVAKEKGRPPAQPLKDRMRMLAALAVVDRVIPGDRGKRWKAVIENRPDVICVGHDQNAAHPAFLDQLARLPKVPKVVRLRAERPRTYKSSKLRGSANEPR